MLGRIMKKQNKCVNSTKSTLSIALLAIASLLMVSTNSFSAEPIKPLKAATGLDSKKVVLGKRLFKDKSLSKDGSISCESCHSLKAGGTDNVALSTGVNGAKGVINSPTIYNSGLLFRQFWDGRAETLEDQIDGPIQNPVEMGSLWPDVVAKLYQDGQYPDAFRAIYSDEITPKNIKNAIAEFERSLVTTDSRFDRFLLGEKTAISKQEKKGYRLFKKYGCISCHQGAAVGGNMFQVFGVINSYFKKRGKLTEADMGRFNSTGNPEDKHMFKVPSLRLVALTAPYLHDGSAKTLRDAVNAMFEFQLGREAPNDEKDAIVAFLKTLAGNHAELGK